MELTDFLRLLRRSWMLISTVTLLGVLIAGLATVTASRIYTAHSTLYVTVQSAAESSAGEAVQGSSAAQARVRSYVKVIPSAIVLQPVITKLGLTTSVASLAKRVTATSQTGTVLIDLAVSDIDPKASADIANEIATTFSKVVVDDLETPEGGEPGLVKVTSLATATTPVTPSTPKVPTNLALGLLSGLFLGVALALLRNTLDTRIHGNADIAALTQVPIIGGIGFDAEASTRPLIVQAEPRSPRAESFRSLRTNLQFIDPGASGGSYVITSAMPSEGKSTSAANLAIAIAEGGASVALIDADLRRPRAAEIMGLEGAVGLSDLLIGNAELEDVLQPWGNGDLTVLAAGRIPPNPSELLGSVSMVALLDELTRRFDYVLLDAPPLLPVTDAAVLSKLTSGAIVITAARSSKKTQLRSALELLDKIGSRTLGIVVTKLPAKGSGAYGYAYAYGGYRAYHGRSPDQPPIGTDARRARRADVADETR